MTDATTRSGHGQHTREVGIDDTITWLQDQFPGWDIQVDQTDTGIGQLRPLWIASREGHHAQAELTAAKLHTRLTEYLEREDRREALMN